jgi:hypothetical protein
VLRVYVYAGLQAAWKSNREASSGKISANLFEWHLVLAGYGGSLPTKEWLLAMEKSRSRSFGAKSWIGV